LKIKARGNRKKKLIVFQNLELESTGILRMDYIIKGILVINNCFQNYY